MAIRCLALLFVVVVLAAAGSARAVPVEFGFTGIVTEGEKPVGTLVAGTYVFESTTPAAVERKTVYRDAVLALAFSGGGVSISASFTPDRFVPPNAVVIVDDLTGGDSYAVEAAIREQIVEGVFTLQLDGGVGLLSGTSLPLAPPDLSAATTTWFVAPRIGAGYLTTLFLIPEPSALLLGGFAVAFLLAAARRYDSRSS